MVTLEEAYAEAIDYMLGYHFAISGSFFSMLINVAENYDIPEKKLSDKELFFEISNLMHEEQQEAFSPNR